MGCLTSSAGAQGDGDINLVQDSRTSQEIAPRIASKIQQIQRAIYIPHNGKGKISMSTDSKVYTSVGINCETVNKISRARRTPSATERL